MSVGIQTTLDGWSQNDASRLNHELAMLGHFPKMKGRTQWNPDFPELHTIWCAVEHVVQTASAQDGIHALSAPEVNEILMQMGFAPQKVKRTIAAILSGSQNIVKINRRNYSGEGHSWAMYVWGQDNADEVNRRDAILAKWLHDEANAERVHHVMMTSAKLGLDRFKPTAGWADDVNV